MWLCLELLYPSIELGHVVEAQKQISVLRNVVHVNRSASLVSVFSSVSYRHRLLLMPYHRVPYSLLPYAAEFNAHTDAGFYLN
jgi:hypothetical protein